MCFNLFSMDYVAHEKYRPVFEKKAQENLKIPTGGKNSLTLPKSDKSINPIHTTDNLGLTDLIFI